MSLFDLFDTLAGRPSPNQQLYAALNQAPGQTGSPQPAPIAPAAAASPPVADASGAGAPPASSGPPGAPAAPVPPGGAVPPTATAAAQAPPPPPQPVTGSDGKPLASTQQPPSDLAQNNQQLTLSNPQGIMGLYLQAVQRQHQEEGLNRAMGGIAAAFAPPGEGRYWGHQFDVPQQDPGGIMDQVMRLQQNQYLMQTRAQDLANIPAYAKQIYGDDPTQDQINTTRLLYNSGQLPQAIEQAQGITGTGPKAQQRQTVMNYQKAHPGEQLPDWMTIPDPAQFAIKAKDIQNEKDTGEADASTATFHGQKMLDTITWLQQHPTETAWALHNPGMTAVRAGVANTFGTPSDLSTAANNIQFLKSNQFAEGMKNVKNLRTQNEANRVGESASKLSGNLSSDQIPGELSSLASQTMTVLANAKAKAGLQMTPQEWAAADARYKNDGKKPGDYYAGSTVINVAPPDAAITMLKQNPSMRGDFDAKYGPGSAASVLGS